MPKAIELLPCPFCGAETQFRGVGVGDENILVEALIHMVHVAKCQWRIHRRAKECWSTNGIGTNPMSDELRKVINEMFEEGKE